MAKGFQTRKRVQGGAWRWDGDKKTTWHEGEVGLYVVEPENPIVKGLSNFDWKDEVYNRMDLSPEIDVLAVVTDEHAALPDGVRQFGARDFDRIADFVETVIADLDDDCAPDEAVLP